MKHILLIFSLLMIIHLGLAGQCILDNPSFEIPGSGGSTFAGWQQVGVTGTSNETIHGSLAAKLIGQNNGGWNISVFWQNLECDPGEQFDISGFVQHSSAAPLTGDCVALVNVEWRNSSDVLIDYESFTVADPDSVQDEYINFGLLSSAAPTGTVSIHLLVGVLQSPTDPTPEVLFDQISCFSTNSPTVHDIQWVDFPSGRTIEFSGWNWRVKGTGLYGPGPNLFNHSEECVWVDEEDRLHLTIQNINNNWYSTEVVLEEALGYGDYIFTTLGSLDQLDVHTILGLFLYQYSPCWNVEDLWWNAHNEIDVEIGRWDIEGDDIAQFVAQPWDWGGNLIRFDASFGEEDLSSYAFNWMPDKAEFRSWHGGPEDETQENTIFTWTYETPHLPRPEIPRVHLNFWQHNGPPATDQEVILTDFTFIPIGGLADPVDDLIINIDNSNVYLEWLAVFEASEYNIYESVSPTGPWTKVFSCSTNFYSFPISENRKFYQVTWE